MSLYSDYKNVSDATWLKLLSGDQNLAKLLLEKCKQCLGLRTNSPVPSLPDDSLQASFVGSSGAKALKEGYVFYQLIKKICYELGKPIIPENNILEFGCGWGRITRFFLKDVYAENLVGVDVDKGIIDTCCETIHEGTFEVVNPMPPVALPESSFDVIFAYSVFSHLAEKAHLLWIEQFFKLLKRDGLLFVTTQKREFIEYCNSLSKDQIVTPWHKSLATAFRPLEDTLDRYDNGELVYSPTGGGGVRDSEFYGEAAFSVSFAENRWTPYFDVLNFDDSTLPQALVVAQKQ